MTEALDDLALFGFELRGKPIPAASVYKHKRLVGGTFIYTGKPPAIIQELVDRGYIEPAPRQANRE